MQYNLPIDHTTRPYKGCTMAVQSIQRAFMLLRTIARHPNGINITELAYETALHKSTVSRLVLSLEAEGAISRDNSTLAIGNGIADLLAASIQPSTLQTLVHPHLRALSQTINETVGLCIPDNACAHFVDQVSGNHTIQIGDWTGKRYPLHTASSGKLFLAYGSTEQLARYLQSPLASYTDKTLATPEQLQRRLAVIRAAGYDWAFEEFEVGLVTVSAPIFNRTGQIIASIYACGPQFRFPPAGKQEEITELVVQRCQAIGQLLGDIG